jgi:hypothetical protein
MSFIYSPPFPSDVAQNDSTFTRSLHHVDWVDGQDLVQASDTADDQGLNGQFHVVEKDLDAIKADLSNAYRLIRELRSALAVALVQIQAELNKKMDKPAKEGKDTKEGKDAKEGKDTKEQKDGKETKEGKEGKETKEHKDGKEGKDTKEHKDGKEKEAKEHAFKEKDGPREIIREQSGELAPADPAAATIDPVGRAFIRIEERPRVGQNLVRQVEPLV